MIKEKLSELIYKRDSIQGDIDFTNNHIIMDMVELISENIDESIYFLDNDYTGEQFVYLSEIFDELAELNIPNLITSLGMFYCCRW